MQNTTLQWLFSLVFIVLMLIIALVLWFKKQMPIVVQNNVKLSNPNSISYVCKGFSLAILNPQLLPFWIMVQVYFNSVQLLQLKTEVHKVAYVLGAGLGAFILLFSLIGLVTKYKTNVVRLLNSKYYYKILAVIFMTIAVQQMLTYK